ncbi:acyltransferase family protein [Parendozoicomonas haliclonae]|uniref:O-acetyltransferase OatA n=1 Tax=Parendozoicomonas haliclonae TaxID=1960125 RepID=A0A1X7ARF4_9GAMM|nr:acyltransferase family protein [Parendozoicomonas haliclonae]SMA50733.1 O-acetyltransferase OatA [Parendozoicomonas haliclonae]
MLKYRPDIDGLRAIAAGLVVLYHFQFSLFQGGYAGVDVFFVITGFVVTGLLMRQCDNGSFRFKDFYTKRVQRLIPAFLLVSLVTFLVISRIYMDEEYYVFSKSWLYSLVGTSNLYYISEFAKYFAPDAEVQPLLHTWSLAVEFQFYLIWPVILVVLYRFSRHKLAPWLFLAVWGAALAWSIHRTQTAPDAAYYELPTRVFEFLIGVGLALFGQRLPQLNRGFAELLSMLGLGLILASALLLKKGDQFPGLYALPVTLGTGLLIYAGMGQATPAINRLLSSRPFVFLGTLSYSVYLWHWPPVAILNYQMVELTPAVQIALILFSLVAGWLSYTFVENRIRRKPWSAKKIVLTLIVVPAVVIWAIQATIRIADDISFRIPESKRVIYKIINQQNAGDIFDDCFDGDEQNFDRSSRCLLGNKVESRKPDAVLLGDSHATSLAGFIEELNKGNGQSTLLVTKASTPFLTAEQSRKIFGEGRQTTRNAALEAYLSEEPTTVILSAWWTSYLANNRYQEFFMATTDWLIENGHKVIILEDVPRLPTNSMAHCILREDADCSLDIKTVEQEQVNFYKLKQRISAKYSQVQWINPRMAMCEGERCDSVLNGTPLYRDDNHLNYAGSKELGKVYLQQFGNPLTSVK